MDKFIQKNLDDMANNEFVDAIYVSQLFSYMARNNITERKHKIRLFKMWFLSGKTIDVNGSARHRVVLRYQPELEHLLKIGFIKRIRNGRRTSRSTELVLNRDKL